MTTEHKPTKRPAFVRDDREVMGTALSLARRLPPTGRKPAEYSLARGVMAYADRVRDLEEQVQTAERRLNGPPEFTKAGPGDFVGHDGWECGEDCDACYFAAKWLGLKEQVQSLRDRAERAEAGEQRYNEMQFEANARVTELKEQFEGERTRARFLEDVVAEPEATERNLKEQVQTLQAAAEEGWEWKGEYGRLKEQLEALREAAQDLYDHHDHLAAGGIRMERLGRALEGVSSPARVSEPEKAAIGSRAASHDEPAADASGSETPAQSPADIPLTPDQIAKAESELQMRAEIHGSAPADRPN